MNSFLALLLSLSIPALGSIPGAFDPDKTIELSDSNAGSTVVLSKKCAGCKLGISTSHDGLTQSAKLQSLIIMPTELKVVNSSTAVVAGWATSFASAVTIFNPASGLKIDEFVCYHPAISPNGQYVAFVRFYQQHGTTGIATSDTVAVYDMSLSPSANNATSGWEVAGIPAFPPSPDGVLHRLQTNITWSSPTQFDFNELADGTLSKITVTMNNGVSSPNSQRLL